MTTRLIIATALAVTAAVVLLFGLIDPLEGGIALLLAVALTVAVRLISGVRMPKTMWISLIVALALGAGILALVAFAPRPEEVDGAVANPLGSGVVVLLWVYRIAVLATVVGAVLYILRLIRAARGAGAIEPTGSAP